MTKNAIVMTNVLRPSIESIGLTQEEPTIFRKWDETHEVCTIIELRDRLHSESAQIDAYIGFVSRYVSLQSLGNVVQDDARLSDTWTDLVFSACRFARQENKGGWNVGTSECCQASIAELSFIIKNQFRERKALLGRLSGWPGYIHGIIDSLPGAQAQLLTILVFALLKLDAPLDQLLISYQRHLMLPDRLLLQLISQKRLIGERYGDQVARSLDLLLERQIEPSLTRSQKARKEEQWRFRSGAR